MTATKPSGQRTKIAVTSDTAGFMAMKGAGYYSKATTGAREVINLATPLILEAIARMRLADDGTRLRVADIGCADGGTSIEMWRKVLRQLRQDLPTRPVEIVYTDLPRNDFGQLFRTIHHQTDTQSYYDELDEVYPLASATSFHQKIFPEASINLAFSATASHYISKVPCAISGHVHMVGAKGSERASYEAVGRAEWDNLLSLRARELVAGGRLVFLNFGIDAKGRYLGHTGGVSMFDTFNRLWGEFAREGVISASEYANTNFPQVYRTSAQFVAPLKEPESAAYRAGLRLEKVEEHHLVCPYAKAFAQHGDAEAFARDYIPTLRSWSEPTFAAGLSEVRPAPERQAILDRFFARYQEEVARAPEGHGMDYIHIHLVCLKEPG